MNNHIIIYGYLFWWSPFKSSSNLTKFSLITYCSNVLYNVPYKYNVIYIKLG